MTVNNNIEKIFQEQFEDFQVEPSKGIWSKINQQLAWKRFTRFNPSHFNIYYLASIVTALTLGTILFINGPDEPKGPTSNDDSIAVVQEKTSDDQNLDVDPDHKSIATGEENMTQGITDPVTETLSKSESATGDVVQPDQDKTILPDQQINKLIDQPSKENVESVESLEIIPVDPAPVANYYSSPLAGCAPLNVMFVNLSEYGESYEWNFGDEAGSSEENPSIVFNEAGRYPVTLRVTNEYGESVITKDTIMVYEKPEAAFEISPISPDLPEDVIYFYNYSKRAVSYEWNFGDGQGSNELEPWHRYDSEDNYNITLKVRSEEGCVDSVTLFDAFSGEGCEIIFPNAFAPNLEGPTDGYYNPNDPTNQVFYPICKGVVEYQLKIYNRTGALLFESNDLDIGWDGYINGTLAKQDVYVWRVRGRFENGKEFVRWGNVTMISRKR